MKISVQYNAPAIEIVTTPSLVGAPLEKLAEQASTEFFRSLDVEHMREPVVVLDILNGGKYYHMTKAWSNVTKRKVGYASLRANRYKDDEGNWKVRIWQTENEELLAQANTLLIGDTIATGATLSGVLDWFINLRAKTQADEAKGTASPCDVFVFSIAGGDAAFSRLRPVGKSLAAKLHGALHLVYANAVYKLDDNGTDLSFVDAIYEIRAQREIEKRLGDFLPFMKCAVWDWGERFYAPDKHVHELAEYYHTLPAGTVPKAFADAVSHATPAPHPQNGQEGEPAHKKRRVEDGAQVAHA